MRHCQHKGVHTRIRQHQHLDEYAQANGYILYCVGPNKIDDGGVEFWDFERGPAKKPTILDMFRSGGKAGTAPPSQDMKQIRDDASWVMEK